MTITNPTDYNNHTGDGVVVDFSFEFRIDVFEDMHIFFDGVRQTVVEWSISNIGNDDGGIVTFNTAPADEVKVTLQRVKPFTQLVDFEPYAPFPAEVVEQSLDTLTMLAIQLQNQMDRALLNPPGTEEQYTLPVPEADKVLVWNSTGTALINGPGEGDFQGWVDDAQQAVIDAEAQVVLAAEQAAISESWANASNTYASNSAASAVESEGWSELSEDWADSEYGVVVGTGFSAKSWSRQAEYWADEDEGVVVPGSGGLYSAKHWALKANNGAIINLYSSDTEMIEVEYIANNSRRLNLNSNVTNGMVKLDATGKVPLDLLTISNLVLRGTFDGSDLCPKFNDNLVDDGEFEEACGVEWVCLNASISEGKANVGNPTLFSSITQISSAVLANAVYSCVSNVESLIGTLTLYIGENFKYITSTGEDISIVPSGSTENGRVQYAAGGGVSAVIDNISVTLHSLIEGWDFEEACGVIWTCNSDATITGGKATLTTTGVSGAVSQINSNIEEDTEYKVIIDIDTVPVGVEVSIGNGSEEVSVTGETVLFINSGSGSAGLVRLETTGGTAIIDSIRVVPADTAECVEPDYRNPSERFTTETFAAGEYYIVSGVVASGVGGHMNLIDKADYTEKVIEVEDNDVILYLGAGDQEPDSPAGWYFEPALALETITAANVSFDDSTTVVSGTTVQAFNKNLDTSVDRKLNKTGGDVTGNVIFDNTFAAVQFRDSSDVAGTAFYMNGADQISIGGIGSFDNPEVRFFQGGSIGMSMVETQLKVVNRDFLIENGEQLLWRNSADSSDIRVIQTTINDDIDIGGVTNHNSAKSVRLWQGNSQAIVLENADIRLKDRHIVVDHDKYYKLRNSFDTVDISAIGIDSSNHILVGNIDGLANQHLKLYESGDLGAEMTFSSLTLYNRDLRLANDKSVSLDGTGVLGYIGEFRCDTNDDILIGSNGDQPIASDVLISQGNSLALNISGSEFGVKARNITLDNTQAVNIRNSIDTDWAATLYVDGSDDFFIGGTASGGLVNIIQGGASAMEIGDSENTMYKTPTHNNQAHATVTGATTIDFTDGGRHSVALTGDAVLSFTPTTNVGNFLVFIDTDSNECTFQAGIYWAGGELPVVDNGVWILSLYWNGTYWFASASQFATV